MLTDPFGLAGQRAPRMAQRVVEAERDLRRQTRTASSGDPVNMDPYAEDTTATLGSGALA